MRVVCDDVSCVRSGGCNAVCAQSSFVASFLGGDDGRKVAATLPSIYHRAAIL